MSLIPREKDENIDQFIAKIGFGMDYGDYLSSDISISILLEILRFQEMNYILLQEIQDNLKTIT